MMTTCQREYGLNNAEINFDTDSEEIFVSISANRKKDENHLQKHAMHLIRLYLTGIDILEGRGVVTYREKDLPLLKKIRAGEIPLDDVFKMADECDEKISAAYKNSKLPDVPDSTKIDKLLIEIYREHFAR